jgi:DnaJ family protein C protein 28
MADKSVDEEIKIKAQQARRLARYMSSTEDLVENQILKAQQEGKFDNLPGTGRPLNLEENPFEPADMRMAFKILKENDFAPHWIELGKEIDADLRNFWAEVDYFRRYTLMMAEQPVNSLMRRRYQRKKENFYYECRLNLEKISKKILDYNLHCPTFWLGRANLIIEEEMSKVTAAIESALEL